MTGPEHYREAEDHLATVDMLSHHDEARAEIVAKAQVHATLALAAATSHLIQPDGSGVLIEWRDAEGRKEEAF